jgi:hypothetical protein
VDAIDDRYVVAGSGHQYEALSLLELFCMTTFQISSATATDASQYCASLRSLRDAGRDALA